MRRGRGKGAERRGEVQCERSFKEMRAQRGKGGEEDLAGEATYGALGGDAQ